MAARGPRPMSVESHPIEAVAAAERALKQGNLALAESYLAAVLDRAPDHGRALVLQGELLERLGRTDEARAVYGRAAEIDPWNGVPFSRKAILQFRARFGAPAPPRPASFERLGVSVRELTRIGRFGNQVLLYGIARLYAARHDLVLEAPDWIGRDLFDFDDPPPIDDKPSVAEDRFDVRAALAGPPIATWAGYDITGYPGSPTGGWSACRDAFRALYQPGRATAPLIETALAALRRRGRTLVGIHLRRGDFGYGHYWTAPVAWYIDWLNAIWTTLDAPVLYIASDDPNAAAEFSDFAPVNGAALGIDMGGADFYLDHALLSRCAHCAISNSSFSFTAAMINDGRGRYVRPDPVRRALVPFDPWNAPVMIDAPSPAAPLPPEEAALVDRTVRGTGIAVHIGTPLSGWTSYVRTRHPRLKVVEADPDMGLDRLRELRGIRHITNVAVERESDLSRVVAGARTTLRYARADCFQFHCSRSESTPAMQELHSHGYALLHCLPDMSMSIVEPSGAVPPGPYLALNRRLLKFLSGQPSPSLDLAALCVAHGVQVRGVIHVGAHEGTEIRTYDALGAAATAFIEANPAVFVRLHKAMAGRSDVVCINRAVSDRPGRVTMHLLSSDMSSSLLRLKEHASAYPTIAPAGTIDVDADTLDAIVRRLPLPGAAYNLLAIDVQGAEALVLRGGADTLACADAVVVEVNFAELFENCAQIEDIEDILAAAGFRRVDMVCVDNAGWSDAFYVRERRTAG